MIACTLSTVLGERRIKVSEVVKDTGIARAVVDRWYHDKANSYDRDVLGRLCSYLKVSPGDLLQLVKPRELFED